MLDFIKIKKVFLLVKDTVEKILKGKPPNKKIFVLHTYIWPYISIYEELLKSIIKNTTQ